MSDVPFLPAAEAEFLESMVRYEAARLGLGGEFLAEVERAVRRITFFPKHGSPYLGGTRRVVLRRFPYSVVYWPDPDDLLIVAIAHHRRSPGYWRNRLPATSPPADEGDAGATDR
ncbi:MAG TPA: type II toxin-antitoxin system RelE/ParE family toxin [Longimicrobiaceae bacterium]|nr:type II toxin-antitoxin system RelE/ParE family toxin [Longimicrobiaceae bacterium]